MICRDSHACRPESMYHRAAQVQFWTVYAGHRDEEQKAGLCRKKARYWQLECKASRSSHSVRAPRKVRCLRRQHQPAQPQLCVEHDDWPLFLEVQQAHDPTVWEGHLHPGPWGLFTARFIGPPTIGGQVRGLPGKVRPGNTVSICGPSLPVDNNLGLKFEGYAAWVHNSTIGWQGSMIASQDRGV